MRASDQKHFPARRLVPTQRFLQVVAGYLLHEMSLEAFLKNYGVIFSLSAVANVGEAIRNWRYSLPLLGLRPFVRLMRTGTNDESKAYGEGESHGRRLTSRFSGRTL